MLPQTRRVESHGGEPQYKPIHTASGAKYFGLYGGAGTLDQQADSRFKIQFYVESYPEGQTAEQWHGNGVRACRQVRADVPRIHPADGFQAVVMTCRSVHDGGTIVQRFEPWLDGLVAVELEFRRYCSRAASTFDSGVHNVFYRKASEALEEKVDSPLCELAGRRGCRVRVRALPVTQGPRWTLATTRSSIATTSSRSAPSPRRPRAARAIGNGVFVVMGGAEGTLQITDTAGETKVTPIRWVAP